MVDYNLLRFPHYKVIRPPNIHNQRLFQLCVGLSPRRQNKKRHNFKDSPSGTCLCERSIESSEYFLVYCN